MSDQTAAQIEELRMQFQRDIQGLALKFNDSLSELQSAPIAVVVREIGALIGDIAWRSANAMERDGVIETAGYSSKDDVADAVFRMAFERGMGVYEQLEQSDKIQYGH